LGISSKAGCFLGPGLATTLHDARYRELIGLLVEARKAAGYTQDVLSARLGRPQSYLGKIETFQRRLDALELFDLIRALELPVGPFCTKAAIAIGAKPPAKRRKRADG
jgi:hypothetical protein